MKANLFVIKGTALAISFFFFVTTMTNTNCSKEPTLDAAHIDSILLSALRVQNCDTFKAMVNNLHITNQANIPDGIEEISGNVETSIDGGVKCTTQEFSATAGYSELSVMDPTASVIYTGALVNGDTWSSGTYQSLIADRLPLTISISTQTDGSPKETVEHPERVSSYREALNKLLARATFSAPPYVNFKIDSIYSEKQARMLTGAHFSGWGAKVSAEYNFGNTSTQSKLLVRFTQKYFTIDMDDPAEPCALFDTLPDLHEFGTSPMYISSVAYGRVAYLMVSSSHRLDSVAWAIHASYSGFGGGGGVDVSKDAKRIVNEASISGFIIGGDGDAAVKAVNGFEGLKEYIIGGGNPSPTSPGAPIAYTLKYLKNREVAKVQLTSDYVVRNCDVIGVPKDIPIPSVPFDLCPQEDGSGQDFSGQGPHVTGKIYLFAKNKKEIWAKFEFHFEQTNGTTKAEINDERFVYTLDQNEEFVRFDMANDTTHIEYIDEDYTPDFPQVISSEFIEKVEIQGDTGDDDLPCTGFEPSDDRSYVRAWLKPFKVRVKQI